MTQTQSLSDSDKTYLERRIYEMIEAARLHRSCLTCEHFDEAKELCGLAGARPPARTIAMGCPAWKEVPPF